MDIHSICNNYYSWFCYWNNTITFKNKEKSVKVILISIFAILFFISISMTCFLGVFAYIPEHVVEKNGEKFVTYVKGFKRTYVDYYNYKNIFVVGN